MEVVEEGVAMEVGDVGDAWRWWYRGGVEVVCRGYVEVRCDVGVAMEVRLHSSLPWA
jgi:hypothetical protein